MGIANIINTSTSSGGGGGEIIRELVNSSDGQGLYFSNTGYIHLANNAAAEFGTSDFSIEFILNQTGEVGSSGGSIYQSATTVNNKFSIENHVSSNVVKLIFFNAVGSATQYDLAYNMAADYNEPTHYVVSCDRSGNAVLYRNGTEVASVSIATAASINLGDGVTSTAMIGNSGSGYTFLGGLYRFRTWNKALSHDEVDTCFQRADVPFADQYGSTTNKFSAAVDKNWGTNQSDTGNDANDRATFDAAYVWGMAGSPTDISVASNTLTFSTAGASNGIFYPSVLSAGKKFRATINVGSVTGSAAYKIQYYTGSAYVDVHTLASGVNTIEFTPTATNGTLYILATSGSAGTLALNAASIANSLVQSGCVTDYDLAFANPTQSLMCQDRAGNSDGTMGGTIQQTQPIVQLNSTSARIGSAGGPETPADGELISKKLKVTSNGNGEIICERQSGAAAIIQSQAAAVKLGSSSNHELQFMTNNIVRAEIDTSGNAAIGGSAFGDLTVYKNATPTKINLQNSTSTNAANKGLEFYLSGNNAGVHNWQNGSMNFATNNVNRLSISATGLVTATSANQTTFTVVSSNAGFGGQSINSSDGTNGKPIISWQRGGAEKAYDYVGTDNARYFNVNSADRLKIDSSGLATFSNEISCTGLTISNQTNTTVGTRSSSKFDHYEEGTFTASLTAATPPTSVPTATGNYIRVGKLCYIQIRFNNVDTSGASGAMEVTGLPFTSANTNDSNVANQLLGQFYNLPWLPSNPKITRNDNKVTFVSQNNGGAWSAYNISANSGVYLHIAGTYVV